MTIQDLLTIAFRAVMLLVEPFIVFMDSWLYSTLPYWTLLSILHITHWEEQFAFGMAEILISSILQSLEIESMEIMVLAVLLPIRAFCLKSSILPFQTIMQMLIPLKTAQSITSMEFMIVKTQFLKTMKVVTLIEIV